MDGLDDFGKKVLDNALETAIHVMKDLISHIAAKNGRDGFGCTVFGPNGGLDSIVAVICLNLGSTLVSNFGFLSIMPVDCLRWRASSLDCARMVSVVTLSVALMQLRVFGVAAMSNFTPWPGFDCCNRLRVDARWR